MQDKSNSWHMKMWICSSVSVSIDLSGSNAARIGASVDEHILPINSVMIKASVPDGAIDWSTPRAVMCGPRIATAPV